MNIYRFECRAVCPIHKELIDVYQVELQSSHLIEVEKILDYFQRYEGQQVFQEDIAKQSAVALGCYVKIVGMHSGVEITSVAP